MNKSKCNTEGNGFIEIDIHGMTKYQAKLCIDSQLKKAKGSLYRIRIIHGYQGGTELKDMVRREYQKHPKVLRLEIGMNQGSTELVLREI